MLCISTFFRNFFYNQRHSLEIFFLVKDSVNEFSIARNFLVEFSIAIDFDCWCFINVLLFACEYDTQIYISFIFSLQDCFSLSLLFRFSDSHINHVVVDSSSRVEDILVTKWCKNFSYNAWFRKKIFDTKENSRSVE
jgi:hypothetical protein